jgi:hypothetical protein
VLCAYRDKKVVGVFVRFRAPLHHTIIDHRTKVIKSTAAASSAAIAADFLISTKSQLAASANRIGLIVL